MKNRKKRILIISILVFISLFITIYSLRSDRKVSFFEKSIKDIGTFFGETIYKPIRFFKDTFDYISDKDKIYSEYNELKKEKDNYESNKERLNELEKENKELKNMLNIDSSLSDYNIINANVVSRDTGYWYSRLVINKGSKNGIKKDMVVTTSKGVIGYIKEVSNYSSIVQLICVSNLKISISVKIKINNDYDTGLLTSYDTKKNVFIIEGISYSGEIKKGSVVTTTGYNKEFPSGLIIGRVKNVTTDNFDLSRIVEVEPTADFKNIEYVRVLEKKATR